jgi:hypothetical protein
VAGAVDWAKRPDELMIAARMPTEDFLRSVMGCLP